MLLLRIFSVKKTASEYHFPAVFFTVQMNPRDNGYCLRGIVETDATVHVYSQDDVSKQVYSNKQTMHRRICYEM